MVLPFVCCSSFETKQKARGRGDDVGLARDPECPTVVRRADHDPVPQRMPVLS